jgi:DNA-binding transcriptional LysR family regulator
VDPEHCIGVLEAGSHGAQQWQFRRKSETYAILPAAPLTFSNCDCAIAAAVRGGGYVRVLCIEAEQQIAAGLLLPVLNDWNDASQPVAMVHARDFDARAEILAFRTFMASIFPSPRRPRIAELGATDNSNGGCLSGHAPGSSLPRIPTSKSATRGGRRVFDQGIS